MVEGQDVLRHAQILVSNGRIAAVRQAGAAKQPIDGHPEVIDAEDALVMPGLINAHTHTAMTLFRGFADDLPLKQWLFEKIFPAESRYLNPDTVYWGALLGCLEMIASGTTCIIDGYFFQEHAMRAVYESGLRGLMAQGVIDFPAPGVPDPKENLNAAKRFIEQGQSYKDRITAGVFCHSPVTCSEETLRSAWETSRQLGLPLQIHLSETSEEVYEIVGKKGKRPVHYLDDLGLIDKGLIAAHGVHVEASEIACLAEKNVGVVHVPESNMKLGCGAAPVSEMVKSGIRPGLGTDGCCSNNDLDLFREMDAAAKLSKVIHHDPLSLNAWSVLKMATVWGAGLLGWEHEIGTIEPGKKADIIVIDLQRPHLCPLYEPVSALVYSANGADVRDVIVDGKILMKDRAFLTLDQEEVMARVTEFSRKIRV